MNNQVPFYDALRTIMSSACKSIRIHRATWEDFYIVKTYSKATGYNLEYIHPKTNITYTYIPMAQDITASDWIVERVDE